MSCATTSWTSTDHLVSPGQRSSDRKDTPAPTADDLRWLWMVHDVEVREATSKGQGVYALRAFEEGDLIFRRRHTRVVTTQGLAGCRTGTCQVVGSFFAMDPERQALLVPHAPPFIRKEYRRRRRAFGAVPLPQNARPRTSPADRP